MSTIEQEMVHAAEGGHHDHHELPFIRKYIFSTDHKMIAKQFVKLEKKGIKIDFDQAKKVIGDVLLK